MDKRTAIGVDIGGTKIAAALVTPVGEVLCMAQSPTLPERGPEAVLDDVAGLVNRLVAQAQGKVLGVGIGTPGAVDPISGTVRNAVNLGWIEVHLAEAVRTRLSIPIPVWVRKDVNATLLGERYFGAGQNCDDFIVITIGSGLGGAVFANGRLVEGAIGNATEIGHLTLDPEGFPCVCGRRGCAETIVSGPGLVRVTRQVLSSNQIASRLEDDNTLTPQEISLAYHQGDETARTALDKVGRTLGIVMAGCCAWLNPARIVLGGGLALAEFGPLVEAARSELERRVVPTNHQQMLIVPSQLTSSAVGAACLVWYILGQ